MKGSRALALGIFLVVALACTVGVLAILSSSVIVTTPSNNTFAKNSIWINTTWSGEGNITIEYNSSSLSWTILNSSNNVNNSYNYSWNTTLSNDSSYNLRITLINSTNSTDVNITLISNITVDNYGPNTTNITFQPMVFVGGFNYTNATPSFRADSVDVASLVSSCEFFNGSNWVNATATSNACLFSFSSALANGAIYNFSLRANDTNSNRGNNVSAYNIIVDANAPTFPNPIIVINSSGQPVIVLMDGNTYNISANVTDAGVGIVNNTNCTARIDNSLSGFTGNILYNATTGFCIGQITLTSGITSANHSLSLNVSDALNNTGRIALNLTMNDYGPNITGVFMRPIFISGAVNYTNATPFFSANISDTASPVASCEFFNGTDWVAATVNLTNKTCSYSYSYSLANATTFNVSFRATDAAGVLGLNKTTSFIVDANAPVTDAVSAVVFVDFGGKHYVNSTPIFFASIAEDGAGITSCNFSNSEGVEKTGSLRASTCWYNYTLTPLADSVVLNTSMHAVDKVNNTEAITSRITYYVDAQGPVFYAQSMLMNTSGSPISVIRNNGVYNISVNVTDAAVGITDGNPCRIELNGFVSGFTNNVYYDQALGLCFGQIILDASTGLPNGNVTFVVNVSDSLNNTARSSRNITIDNNAPIISNVTVTNNHLANRTSLVTVVAYVNESFGFGRVVIVNSTGIVAVMDNYTINTTYSMYNATFAVPGCLNESACLLNITAFDIAGNNGTYVLNGSRQIYLDNLPPTVNLLGSNATGAIARSGENVTFFVKWNDMSLMESKVLDTNLSIYNRTSGQFVSVSAISTSIFNRGNYTNFTYVIPRTDEGNAVIARVSLIDTNGNLNFSDNITVVVQNDSINVSMWGIQNNSAMTNDSTLYFKIYEVGIGVNLSATIVQANGSQNLSLSNSNLSCGIFSYNATSTAQVILCSANATWPLGNMTLFVFAKDLVGNTNDTSIDLIVTSRLPDIVNVSINGALIASTTPNDTYGNFICDSLGCHNYVLNSNNSTLQINWSVDTSLPYNSTMVYLFDNYYWNYEIRNTSVTTLPASRDEVLTPGLNTIVLQSTFNTSNYYDSFEIDFVANVPINASSMRTIYTSSNHGNITNWTLYVRGVDVTNQNHLVNDTINIVTDVDGVAKMPVHAIFNHSVGNGLLLTWSIPENKFNITFGSASDYASAEAGLDANVSFLIKSTVDTSVVGNFFSNVTLVSVKINVSSANRSFYYVPQHDYVVPFMDKVYRLPNCTTIPTVVANDSSACYVSSGSDTVLYLPRFDLYDQIFAAERPTTNLSVDVSPTGGVISQSIIPLTIDVSTAFPATTLCVYNLSSFNATSHISKQVVVKSLNTTNFSFGSYDYNDNVYPTPAFWHYQEDIYKMNDSQYNLSVVCYDQFGVNNTIRYNFRVNDTTSAIISEVNITDITQTKATFSASANEYVNFTVWYGTNITSLTSTKTADSPSALSASITLNNLVPGTTYYYQFVVYDAKKQYSTQSYVNGSFKTLDVDGSGSGGGGSSGAAGDAEKDPTVPGNVQDADSRLWSVIKAGTTLEYIPKGNLSIKSISIRFINTTTAVSLGVKQYTTKPSTLPSAPGVIFSYLSIDAINIVGNTETPFVEFSLPLSWLKDRGIAVENVSLYRYEKDVWVAYPAKKTNQIGADVRFTAVIPGFSFFAIGGIPSKIESSIPIIPSTLPQPGPKKTVVIENVTAGSGFGNGPEILTKAPKKQTMPWFTILIILVVIGVLTFVGFDRYRKYQIEASKRQVKIDADKNEVNRRKEIVVDGEQVGLLLTKPLERKEDHDPMAALHQYIVAMRDKHKNDEEIKAKLVTAGWDATIVELELLRK